ncbi:MAG: DUF2975 domain-containing protein [Clostridia bacterium]|jgi:predicted Na+-dependent transporter|nr:DUF2975 domain-containing protein [Clostridia bacterium]MBQ1555153.1 DUF2975 domain-containing protein [Clostridia bacterium]MBQ4396182.1 DUF2975 domain-containing protein [Clostridia bacterium]
MNKLKKFLTFNLSHMTCLFISLIFLAGVVIYVTLPWLVDLYIDHTAVEISQSTHRVMISMLYSIGVPVFITLAMAWLLTMNISRGKSFVKNNVTYLRVVSVASLVIAVLVQFFSTFLKSFFPFIITIIFLLLALLSAVFANLFQTAIQYKEENDLTV